MKLALIYDPNDPKLSPEAYSWTYRDMFLALTDAFESVQYVTGDGSAADIDADAVRAARRVGVTAGASTPDALIGEVVAALRKI